MNVNTKEQILQEQLCSVLGTSTDITVYSRYEYKAKSTCALQLNLLQFSLWVKNQTEKKKHLQCVTLMN